ncbi:MAG TPA: metalloregulator ArsR/SmtB family transcription factor [Thermoanaerobaculia bacterium]|nr:metalloregulator ArsR/SmtB family transcription factor [Thermoanaerobaculia bacterium]
MTVGSRWSCRMPPRHKMLDPEAAELIAARFRVLAEPIRLRILEILRQNERSVSELAEEVGTSQPNVSKHLRILQEEGLIGRRQEGNTVFCFIADPTVFELCELVCGGIGERMARKAAALKRARR